MNILFIIDYYLPTIKGGGPVKSISLLKDLLEDSLNIDIVTYNHDVDGEQYNKKNLLKNVIYLNHPLQIFRFLNKYNLFYFNSLFSRLTLVSLIFLLFRTNIKIIIAPRGEIFTFNIKNSNFYIKSLIIYFIKKMNITWHLTSEIEKKEFTYYFGEKNMFRIIPNLIDNPINSFNLNITSKIYDYIFVGRAIIKKGLLLFLKQINFCQKEFNICLVVIIEDHNYWEECKIEILNSKHNIQIFYNVESSKVIDFYNCSKFCIMPSYNENHGHVSYEALRSNCIPITSLGCPISKYLLKFNLVIDLDFSFNTKLDQFVNMNNNEYLEIIRQLNIEVQSDFDNNYLKNKYIDLLK